MRIFIENSRRGCSYKDILTSIEDELGFTVVNGDNDYIVLGPGFKLYMYVDRDEVKVKLELPSRILTNAQSMEIYASVIESSIEVLGIISRISGGSYESDN